MLHPAKRTGHEVSAELPPEIREAVKRTATNPIDPTDVDAMADGATGPRYIVIQQQVAPKKGFMSSFWGRALKTVAAVAVAGAIAAAAFFGMGGQLGAPIDPTGPAQPVAPVTRVQETRSPTLPNDTATIPADTAGNQRIAPRVVHPNGPGGAIRTPGVNTP